MGALFIVSSIKLEHRRSVKSRRGFPRRRIDKLLRSIFQGIIYAMSFQASQGLTFRFRSERDSKLLFKRLINIPDVKSFASWNKLLINQFACFSTAGASSYQLDKSEFLLCNWRLIRKCWSKFLLNISQKNY